MEDSEILERKENKGKKEKGICFRSKIKEGRIAGRLRERREVEKRENERERERRREKEERTDVTLYPTVHPAFTYITIIITNK